MARQQRVETPLQRILAMRTGEWFGAHMDDYFERSETPRHDPGWFHPSALSHPCDAFLAFQFLGLSQPNVVIGARQRRIFDNGHSTERRWQDAIYRAGLSMIPHSPFTPEWHAARRFEIQQYRIRGEFDNKIRHPETREPYIWEFKTMNTDRFKDLSAPLDDHVTQVHPYMFSQGVLQSIIVYENKNTQETKEFIVYFNGDRWRRITERIEIILDRLARRVEVVRHPVPRDNECPYYDRCAMFDFSKVGV